MIYSTKYATWKGFYAHINSICSLLQVFVIISCSFSVFVENCILLPKGINEYCTCMVLIFYPFTLMLMQRNEIWYTYTPLGI